MADANSTKRKDKARAEVSKANVESTERAAVSAEQDAKRAKHALKQRRNPSGPIKRRVRLGSWLRQPARRSRKPPHGPRRPKLDSHRIEPTTRRRNTRRTRQGQAPSLPPARARARRPNDRATLHGRALRRGKRWPTKRRATHREIPSSARGRSPSSLSRKRWTSPIHSCSVSPIDPRPTDLFAPS